MARAALMFLFLLCCTACSFGARKGDDRWKAVLNLEPRLAADLAPFIASDKGLYQVGEPLTITVSAKQETNHYVLLMLPNGNVLLLTPSPKIQDNKAKLLTLPPATTGFEFFAPGVPGICRLALFTSEQSLNPQRQGWLPAGGPREFPTWPADLALSDALDFIERAFDEKPWAVATAEFEIAAPPEPAPAGNP